MSVILECVVENETFKINFNKTKNKHTYFRFRNGQFYVNAGRFFKENDAIKWVEANGYKLVNKSKTNNLNMESNDTYILGIKYNLTDCNSCIVLDKEIFFEDKEDLEQKLKKLFLNLVTERVRYYEQLMGVKPYKIRVQNMKTRLGSNSKRTHTLNFSTKLMSYSIPIIDSVVVHELAHYFVFNHSDKFYNVVYKYCPQYKYYRKCILKEIYHD